MMCLVGAFICLFIVDVENCSEDSFDMKPDGSVVVTDHLHADTLDVAFYLRESGHYSLCC